MDIASWVVLFFLLLATYSIMILARIHFVSELTRRLLDEESDWIYYHWSEFQDGRRQGPWFQRQRRLPPFAVMLHKFWRPVGSFKRELGPVEQYYPLKK